MISARSSLKILFALCCLFSFTLAAVPIQFENVKALRSFDVTTGVVREEVGIRAKNVDDSSASIYYFTLPNLTKFHKVASLSASLRKENTPLEVSTPVFDENTNTFIYAIHLSEPVQPKNDVLINIKIVYTHSLRPLPAKIPQVARQHFLFSFNSYILSPYFTFELKTTVNTPSPNIVSHNGAEGKSTANKNKVIYGPYNNLAPYSFFPGNCHFENSKPLLTVTSLERDIEVSHWGKNLAVEEHYALRNDGASLEGEFNRVQYQMSSQIHDQTNVFKSLNLELPVSAKDVYYRDEVGNVSTSNFRVQHDKSILNIRPRYPIFGGWNTTWYHGYNADLSSFVHKANNKYILNVKFVENTKEVVIDHATVRVILPEGSTNIKVVTPFEVDSKDVSSYSTYFDSTGRTMVILKKSNIVKEHETYFQVEYEYSTVRLLQKPIVVSSVLFGLFVISIIISKMSFSIGSTKSNLKTE